MTATAVVVGDMLNAYRREVPTLTHGSYAAVVCLTCGQSLSRASLDEQLEELNPGFVDRAEKLGGIAVAR